MSYIFGQVGKLSGKMRLALLLCASFLSIVLLVVFSGHSIASTFNDPLVDAADLGDKSLVDKLLKQGHLPDSKGDFGTTALMRAAFRGNVEIIKTLVESGAFVNAADVGGETSLHLAAKNGHEEVVKELLYYGAYIDVPDKEQWTPLMRAALAKQPIIVKDLIEKGADVTAVNNINESVLVHAAISGIPDIAASILGSRKADKISKEQKDMAIGLARRKNYDKVEKLISTFVENGNKGLGTKLAQNDSSNDNLKTKDLKESSPEQLIPPIKYSEKKYQLFENKEIQAATKNKVDESEKKLDENKPLELAKVSDPVKPEAANSVAEVKNTVKEKVDEKSLPKTTVLKTAENSSSSSFFLQLGTFKNGKEAAVAWDKVLTENGRVLAQLKPTIVEDSLPSAPRDEVFRLRAGTVATKTAAESNCNNLRSHNVECYVVEVANSPVSLAELTNKAPSKTETAAVKEVENKSANAPIAPDIKPATPANPLAKKENKPVNNVKPESSELAAGEQKPEANQSKQVAGNYPKLGDSSDVDSAPLDITPKQSLAPIVPANKSLPVETENKMEVQQKADAVQGMPWLESSVTPDKVNKSSEIALDPVKKTDLEKPATKPENPTTTQVVSAPPSASSSVSPFPSQQQIPLAAQSTQNPIKQFSPNIKPAIKEQAYTENGWNKSYLSKNQEIMNNDSFAKNKDEIRSEIQEKAREDFFNKQGITPTKRPKKEYDDFYKQMQNTPKDSSVSEAVMVPDETYFAGSKTSSNVFESASNWLNIYNLPSEAFANDYGVRMFKSDESLGNVQLTVKKSDAKIGTQTMFTMRVGPIAANKAGTLCNNVRAGGYGCSVSDGDAASTIKNSSKDSSGTHYAENTLAKVSAQEGYWINLGAFPSNSEAEYYWMFLKDSNADVLNPLQHEVSASEEKSGKAVKLLTGPFNVKQRASQICNIMRFRNIACLVTD